MVFPSWAGAYLSKMTLPPTSRPVALITGASRGIGAAIALRLAPKHDLILTARDATRLSEVATACEALGATVRCIAADVRDAAGLADQLSGVPVDVLVNNAGLGILKPFLETTAEEWHRQVDVNVNALYHVTRAVLPGMVARGRGHVCIIGSMAGRNTFAGGTCYAGTKHFVMGFAESLLLEVRDAGVAVSVITPGSVDTDFFPEGTNRTWMLDPQNVADAVGFTVEAPAHMLVHRLEVRPLSTKRPRAGHGDRATAT